MGDSAAGSRQSGMFHVFPLCEAGILHVYVRIDEAGEDMESLEIKGLLRGRSHSPAARMAAIFPSLTAIFP